ncbi:MAG: phosphatidate cytidylyltransferase [Anaerolineae bacterium]|nr:MAG: phosphatidate cytidylyltransferase [Anaerolineae bacterium]
MNNYFALAFTFAAALAWLRLNDFLAHRGWVESRLSRKIIHIGTGPIFVLCWLLFDDAPAARYLAALVPLTITAQFVLVGLGVIRDDAAVQAMSRSGDRREILRGPLFYGVMFVLLTVLYWKESPIGMTALMLMCGGDGLADVVGRRWGKKTLPWAAGKTWPGTLAMFLGGFLLSLAVLGVYVARGVFLPPLGMYFVPLLGMALGGTLIESLPLRDVDNLTVTLGAALLGHLLGL